MDARSPLAGAAFLVLGPLEVRVEGRPVPVPTGAQRTLLVMLLLSPRHAVGTPRLLDGLWGEELPQDPRAALHTAVARLRRTLGPAGTALRTLAPGYALEVPPDSLDSERFNALHTTARSLLHDPVASDPDAASDAAALLRSALQLWRGAAWGEFADGVASGDALRLEEGRILAHEDLAQALITTGRTAEAAELLSALVVEHPLRDRSVALLVDALHRYGRTADALRVFDGYRERLAEELGLDPSPQLAALHQRVLRQELPELPVRARPSWAGAPSTRPSTASQESASASSLSPSPEAPRGPLVGRDADVAAVCGLLAPGSPVTVVGPGGVGKSRLAFHVADQTAGARWVDLVPARDRASVAQAIADALDLEPGVGRSTEHALRDRLRSDPGLVVLDNCEHVLDGVAAVLGEAAGGAATILATSRERLGVYGERVVVLDPLGLPEPGTADPGAPAVQLFLARAAEAGADLGDEPDVLRRVGDVCRALDGVPLALELAAARMGALTLDDLAERLDRRFDLLNRGPRTAPRRHRTLRSVVDWSYDLLDDAERTTFTRLSVFPAGFDLAAAEAVVADDRLPVAAVADLVAVLADRSMVVRPSGTTRGRYRLLDTLRQYALSRLPPEELATTRRRHALWAAATAESAREGLEGPEEARWAGTLEELIEDLRATWRWTLEAHEPEIADRLVAATWRWAHWRLRADVLSWGARIVEARPGDAPAVAYAAAVGRAWLEGDLDAGERLARAAFDRFGRDDPAADVSEMMGDVDLGRGRVVEAAECYEKAERVRARDGHRVAQSIAASNRLLALAYAGLATDQTVRETLALAARTGNPSTLAFARYTEGEVRAEHDEPRAVAALEESLALAESVGNRLVTGVAMTALVALRGRSAVVEPATFELFHRVVTHWSTTRNPVLLVTALRNLVVLLGRLGRHADAVELWAALRGVEEDHPSFGAEAERLASTLRAARDDLGPAFDEAVARGADRGGLVEVAGFALELCDLAASAVGASPR